ncbi:hypothetical protein Taro_053973 [Colocasia esculenta]|uniref:TF-B3 domain-containing protein n=1 Tax=Colocasia esculenta TaxID=4460 RepID=A0A843XP45_COLES|nr:hypothetical protein [Colocasia esculenta]
MEFVQGGADRQYFFEEEDTEEQEQRFSHHPPFTRAPPPSSSSSSSSSSARWAPQQMDSTDDHPNQASGSVGGGGGDPSEQQQQERLAAAFVEKEHMFDKVVTPSDVGKLNRLVIPKQHAEKYFPLDASSNEKGLLLNFEDRTGKQWRFRYSYWNSSQSYVMTKGWSRFVKDKRLDAGDTVSFGRGVGEAARDRLFIDWRRRPVDPPRLPARLPVPGQTYHFSHQHDPTMMMSFARSVPPWGRLVMPPPAHAVPSVAVYDHHRHHLGYGYSSAPAASNPFWYLRSAGAGSVQVGGASSDRAMPVILDSVPLVPSSATAKRVRLFGVNLDCSAGEEADSEGDGMAASGHPRPPPLPPLQLRLGVSEMVESPRKDKHPMSLDLGM